ncbi:MAG: TAXI family TRAP transporter solute-binding subunit [Woeseiaceae bacterium]|nr:TAXI family TRAP transporter solute-binding subunit [Woeseiaceae bacterium]
MKRTVVLFLLCLLAGGCGDELAAKRPYILATATTGGTYYPVGVALATITKARLADTKGISLAAISSAGSAENIKLMRDNQAQFALLQGIFVAWAWDGSGPVSRPQPWLRSIAATWQNTDHFVLLRSLAQDGTIMDLARLDGERFVLGARNSGAMWSGHHILTSLGIDYEKHMTLAWMGYGATANAIQDGTIVGMNVPGGVPVTGITRAFAAKGEELLLLGFTDAQIAAINARYPLWKRAVIRAGTYPGQAEDVQSIAHPNVLAVRADVPEDDVYAVTRSIFENLAALHEIHRATRELTLATALDGLGAPLHPGAARFYREQGIEIPDRLVPP